MAASTVSAAACSERSSSQIGAICSKYSLRRGRPARAHGVEALQVGGEHRVVGVDGVERRSGERAMRSRVGEAEERPGALAVLDDQPGVDEQLQVPRHAGLRLAEDLGQVGDGQFAVAEHGDDPQPRLLADGAQRVERLLGGEPFDGIRRTI